MRDPDRSVMTSIREFGRIAFLIAAGLLGWGLSDFLSKPVFAADSPTMYSGGGMVLQLEIQSRTGDTRGVLYTKETVYRFLARRLGMELRSDEISARNDRSAPYRRISGSVSLRITEAGQKVALDMNSPGRNLSAVFRPQMDARVYHMLSRYGDTYCDSERLVFLLPDAGGDDTGFWVSRVMGSAQPRTLGFYFGPSIWYYFVAEGDSSAGLSSERLELGGGALEEYLEGAKVRATVESGKLNLMLTDSRGAQNYQLPFQASDRSCSKAIMRWTTKRRLPPKARMPASSVRPAAPPAERKEEKAESPLAAPPVTKEEPREERKTQPAPVQQAAPVTEPVAPATPAVPAAATPPASSDRVAPPAQSRTPRLRDRVRLREVPSRSKPSVAPPLSPETEAPVAEPETYDDLPEQDRFDEEDGPSEPPEEGGQ